MCSHNSCAYLPYCCLNAFYRDLTVTQSPVDMQIIVKLFHAHFLNSPVANLTVEYFNSGPVSVSSMSFYMAKVFL